MRNCSESIFPDSLSGMIFAMDSLRGGIVLLNGPTGCRFYHSTTSQFLTAHPVLTSPSGAKADYDYLNDWFFRQPRIPCTYIDSDDYIYGTIDKVREALRYISENVKFDIITIVNSPGASLIGDDLKGAAAEVLGNVPCVVLETPGISEGFASGFSNAMVQLIRQAAAKLWRDRPVYREKSVNILGMSLWHRYHEGDMLELRWLLGLCGIDILTFPGAECSFADLKKLPEARLNIVLYPELSRESAELLEEITGVPMYVPDAMPVGFKSVEDFVTEVCGILECDPEPALEEIGIARARSWQKIHMVHETTGMPEGATFAIEGFFSQVYSFTLFMMDYLGMVPVSIRVEGGMTADEKKKMRELLSGFGVENALDTDISGSQPELVFGNANTIGMLKAQGKIFCGIETALPSMGYIDIVTKTQIGIRGTMFLIEQILNGLGK